MKILITGLGITGKSTLRRKRVKALRGIGMCLPVDQYDADRFKELRDPADADCLEALPRSFSEELVYIIEDVHGTIPEEAVMPLSEYTHILYVKTGIFSHFLFWLPRIWRWFQKGQFSWEADSGWKGTGKPKDWRNICPIFKELLNNFQNREKWIKEDLKAIAPFNHTVIDSYWSRKGPKFKQLPD